MKSITIESLERTDKDKVLVVDIRPEDQYQRGTFPGAVNLPMAEFEDRKTELELYKDKEIYLMCHTGERSLEYVQDLIADGYDAGNVTGGYRSYLKLTLTRFVQKDSEEQLAERTREIERSIIKKFRKSVWRPFTKALNEYQLVQEGDKIAVCISGGKDSMLMAKLFQELKRHGKVNFEVVFLVMNPGYNEDNWNIILNNAKLLVIPLTVFESDIFDTVATIDKNPCYLCARMRRGYLYSKAKELGCNKIALGHHFDDVIETILMGMLYSAKIEIKAWRDYNKLQFIQCACRFTENCSTCGGGRKSKRDEMKELVEQFRNISSVIDTNIFNSIHNINLNTVIGYHKDDMKYNFLDDYDTKGKKTETEG